jgi:hypothetical protein
MIAPRCAAAFSFSLMLCACGSGSTTPSTSVATRAAVVRFIEGAPNLETIINGVPQSIGAAYLSVDGATISSQFPYGEISQYTSLPAGVHAVEARSVSGYFVGPLKTDALQGGKSYTVIVLGSYPNYRAVAYEDPANDKNASLAVYEASPAFPTVDFGEFRAAQHSGFKRLGTVRLESVAAVSLGHGASDFGAYAGRGAVPLPNGALTIAQVDTFDSNNRLPFNNASRFSLFVLDPAPNAGPVFGSLDR